MIRWLLLIWVASASMTAFGQVVINEIQASNSSIIADEDGDFEDWIELYNMGAAPVDLDGYFISDDYDNPTRWRIPAVTVAAGETLLIWASGKDRSNPSQPLHTNFSISASGEEILLSDAAGQRLDEVAPLAIPTDVSWGRSPDGADHWVYFLEPTPAESNTTEGYSDIPTPSAYVHVWVFDNGLANNTELETIDATLNQTSETARIVFQSALSGYPNTDRTASMERRNAPTDVNYPLEIPYADFNMRGLQVTQPFVGDAGENTLILEMPTTGYKDVLVQFAALDEGAADSLQVDYATNSGAPAWTTEGLSQSLLPLTDIYQLYSLDFTAIPAAQDNPYFKVRIRFVGTDMSVDNGDRVTFNNFTLEGQAIPEGTPDEPDDPAAPINNRFADAQSLTGAQGIATGNNQGATTEAGEPTHGQAAGVEGGASIWWLWQAPETERMIFSVNNNSTVSIYTGDELNSLEPVPVTYDSSNELRMVAQAGQVYRIAVAALDGAEGDVALTWDIAPPAAEAQIIYSAPGQPGVICEVPGCDTETEGTARASILPVTASATVPGQDVTQHRHQLLVEDGNGAELWRTEFTSDIPGSQSRIIGSMNGFPILVTELTASNNDYEYQVEAYPSGLARHRIVADGIELLQVHLAIPGSRTTLNEAGDLNVTAPLPGGDKRVALHINSEARVNVRYQERTGDSWIDLGDLLVNTLFPEGSRVHITRDQNGPRVQVETLIEQNLSF